MSLAEAEMRMNIVEMRRGPPSPGTVQLRHLLRRFKPLLPALHLIQQFQKGAKMKLSRCVAALTSAFLLVWLSCAQAPLVAYASADVQVNSPDNASPSLDNCTTQSETQIAYHGSTVIVGYNDTREIANSGTANSLAGFAYSQNSGTSFTDAGRMAPAANTDNYSDPAMAVNSTGRVFYAFLAGPGFSSQKVAVARSTSTSPSVTFGTPVLIPGLTVGGVLDRESIAVDTSGGAFNNRVYVAYTEFDPTETEARILFVHSTTSPLTFSTPVALTNFSGVDTGALPVVGPNGNVYVEWSHFDSAGQRVQIVKSTDGGVNFHNPDPADPAPVKSLPIMLETPREMSGTLFGIRTLDFSYMAVDSTPAPSPTRNNLYIVYQSRSSATGADLSDVFFTKSTDGGRTWSDPRAVNNGPGVTSGLDITTNDNWQPSIGVSPKSGHILVSFYDRREDSGNTNIRVYGAL